MTRRARRCFAALAALVLLATPAPRAAAMSYQGERDLGRRFDLAARQQFPLIADPEVVDYLNGIGRRIAGGLDGSYFDYRFTVVRDPRINAFAVPGGYVYVHSGLIANAKSDDEVASVLAHEIGHVHAHHLVRQQEATELLNYASVLGMLLAVVQPVAGAAAVAANQAVALQYRREFEQEADYLGARYMQSAGYDPRAMLDFFKQLADDARNGPTAAPPYLQTHPMTDERLNRLEAVMKTNQWAPRQRPPASFALRRAQALVRVRAEKADDALAYYRQQLDQQPDDATAQYLYGLVCLEAGQLEAAGAALSAAQAGGLAAAPRELGRLALRQRRFDDARRLLAGFVESQPDDAGARVELGKVLEAQGDRAAAMAEYHRALELAPQLEAAQYGYGILAGRAGQPADGFYHLATAARLKGDYATALSQYARAAAMLPADDPRGDDARQWSAALSEFLQVPVPQAE